MIDGAGSVEQDDDNVTALDAFESSEGTVELDTFRHLASFLEAGGIDENDFFVVVLENRIYRIARRTWNIRDHLPLLTQECIDQG